MPKKEKVPKKYKVESRSLTKKINQAVSDISKFQRLSQVEKNQVLSALQGSPDYQRLYATLNPSDKQYIDLNVGSPKGRSAGLIRSEKPSYEKISQLTPEQSRAAYAFLEQTVPEAFLPENATPQQMQAAKMQGLGGTLAALEKPYNSPLNTQLNQMFGHMANPVMQAYLNPERGNEARGNMFPDRIQQEYQQGQAQQQQENNPLRQLLGSLGEYGMQQHVMPWLQKPENLESLYNGVGNIANNAYQGGQDVWNYLRNPEHGKASSPEGESIPAYFGRRALYGATHPLESAQEYGNMMGQMAGGAYGGIQDLLSKLGSYIPNRGQKQ